MQIRPLRASDRRAWATLWDGYLAFYEQDLRPEVTEHTWTQLMAGHDAVIGLGAVDGEELIGFCHLITHPSTWTTGSYCYLEDLFVSPDSRTGGVGGALIEAAQAEARRIGSDKLYWHTQETNTTARRLYDRVASHQGFIVYEVEL